LKRAGGVPQGVGPESKPKYQKKKEKKRKRKSQRPDGFSTEFY
jgi:hypothetical protein